MCQVSVLPFTDKESILPYKSMITQVKRKTDLKVRTIAIGPGLERKMKWLSMVSYLSMIINGYLFFVFCFFQSMDSQRHFLTSRKLLFKSWQCQPLAKACGRPQKWLWQVVSTRRGFFALKAANTFVKKKLQGWLYGLRICIYRILS